MKRTLLKSGFLFTCFCVLLQHQAMAQGWEKDCLNATSFDGITPVPSYTDRCYYPGVGGALVLNVEYQSGYDPDDSSLLISFDENGDSLWGRTIPVHNGFRSFYFRDVQKFPDGRVVAGGYFIDASGSTVTQNIYYKIYCYSNAGALIDSAMVYTGKVYQNAISEPLDQSAIKISGSDVLLAMSFNRGIFTALSVLDSVVQKSMLVKLDQQLNTVWKDSTVYQYEDGGTGQIPEIPGVATYAGSMMVLQDQGIAIIAYADTFSYGYGYWIKKYTPTGSLAFSVFIDSITQNDGYTGPNSLLPTADSGILATTSGYTSSYDVKSGLYHFSKSGALVDSLTITDTIAALGNGFRSSNGDFVFQYGNSSVYPPVWHFVSFSEDLQYQSTLPFSTTAYFGHGALYPNDIGGALMITERYEGWADYALTLLNFDSLGNTYPAQRSGNLTYDLNANCVPEAADLPLTAKVAAFTNSAGKQWYGISDANGHYKRSLPYGNYTITTAPDANKQVNCPNSGQYNIGISTPGEQGGNDFYESLIPGLINISFSAVPDWFIPGFNTTPYFLVKNNGSSPFTGELKIIGDPALDYVSSVPSGTVSGDTITFTFSALQPDSVAAIQVTWNTPASTSLGTLLHFAVHIPAAGDAHPEDNDDTLTMEVVGAFDPNDKAVNRPLHFHGDRELVYKVRFQNTGTWPAKNVLVVDSMDSQLDFSTFKLLETSHPNLNVSWNPGGRMFFNYPDIYLPDSNANEPASHGYFVYSIHAKDDAQIGDTILNTAYIYFDYNSPVVTNTTMNILSAAPSSTGTVAAPAANLVVVPNPTRGEVTLRVPGNDAAGWTAVLTDMTGRVVATLPSVGSRSEWRVKLQAPPGLYLLRTTQPHTGTQYTTRLLITE